MSGAVRIDRVTATSYRVPTATPEQDGTLDWDATTAVVVHLAAGDDEGVGWTYSGTAAHTVISDLLTDVLVGRDPAGVTALWEDMRRACRNVGIRGLVMQAISAVDIALWDLAGRRAGRPVHKLFGADGAAVPIYRSGGFTNLTERQLADEIAERQAAGCQAMKIKIGRDDARDRERIEQVRGVAPGVELMVDANGAYTRGRAGRMGHLLDELGVVWFEEPVSSDDVEGLALLRAGLRCDVTAGEYVSDAYGGVGNLRHVEWFVDHVRLEPMLWVGVPRAADGTVAPNAAPGHGLRLRPEAEEYRL